MAALIPEQIHVVDVLSPAADGSGRNSAAVSLKNFHGPAILEVSINQGASNTVALTVQQCTAVDGTAAKAITVPVPIYASQDLAAASGDVLARQADAVSFTTSSAVALKLVRFVIDPASLDVAGGFDCLRVQTGASSASNITAARVILAPTYAPAPSARVN